MALYESVQMRDTGGSSETIVKRSFHSMVDGQWSKGLRLSVDAFLLFFSSDTIVIQAHFICTRQTYFMSECMLARR